MSKKKKMSEMTADTNRTALGHWLVIISVSVFQQHVWGKIRRGGIKMRIKKKDFN